MSMNKKKLHKYHTQALFLLFLFIALFGVSVLVLQGRFLDATGAVTATAEYTACTDYGNYIILSNDAGWKLVKKDICTGSGNKYIRKAACVLRDETAENKEYIFVYTKLSYCPNSQDIPVSCAVDSNNAAYCPE